LNDPKAPSDWFKAYGVKRWRGDRPAENDIRQIDLKEVLPIAGV
jgi:hypothetical protein